MAESPPSPRVVSDLMDGINMARISLRSKQKRANQPSHAEEKNAPKPLISERSVRIRRRGGDYIARTRATSASIFPEISKKVFVINQLRCFDGTRISVRIEPFDRIEATEEQLRPKLLGISGHPQLHQFLRIPKLHSTTDTHQELPSLELGHHTTHRSQCDASRPRDVAVRGITQFLRAASLRPLQSRSR